MMTMERNELIKVRLVVQAHAIIDPRFDIDTIWTGRPCHALLAAVEGGRSYLGCWMLEAERCLLEIRTPCP